MFFFSFYFRVMWLLYKLFNFPFIETAHKDQKEMKNASDRAPGCIAINSCIGFDFDDARDKDRDREWKRPHQQVWMLNKELNGLLSHNILCVFELRVSFLLKNSFFSLFLSHFVVMNLNVNVLFVLVFFLLNFLFYSTVTTINQRLIILKVGLSLYRCI